MSYYFLAASLPMLTLDAPPQMSSAEFKSICGDHLTSAHESLFDSVLAFAADTTGSARPATEHPFARSIFDSETQIRNSIAKERAASKGVDASAYQRDHGAYDCHIPQAVSEALSHGNPRDTELAVDKLRWSLIEERQGTEGFGIEAIVAYGLKLKLAERWASLDEDAGRKSFEAIIQTLVDDQGQKQPEENTP
jgi:hypothetical protein